MANSTAPTSPMPLLLSRSAAGLRPSAIKPRSAPASPVAWGSVSPCPASSTANPAQPGLTVTATPVGTVASPGSRSTEAEHPPPSPPSELGAGASASTADAAAATIRRGCASRRASIVELTLYLREIDGGAVGSKVVGGVERAVAGSSSDGRARLYPGPAVGLFSRSRNLSVIPTFFPPPGARDGVRREQHLTRFLNRPSTATV